MLVDLLRVLGADELLVQKLGVDEVLVDLLLRAWTRCSARRPSSRA